MAKHFLDTSPELNGWRSASRSKAPVFVVGSARSGTHLLYHTLLSSGAFPIYRTEPVVFDLLAPKFGDLSKRRNRARLLEVWFKSYQYRVSGLDRKLIEEKVLAGCRNAGDFVSIVMNEIAIRQVKERWAVWGPDNLLHIPSIARTVPGALFIHIVRDVRDVAFSMYTKKFIRPFPWDKSRGLLVAALHWKWKVEWGRRYGQRVGDHYLEIHFEDLVRNTREILAEVSRFIGQELDHERIQQTSFGTLRRPNSTFAAADGAPNSDPVGRWRTHLSKEQIVEIESAVGILLEELGYTLEFPELRARSFRPELMKHLYSEYFDLKEWLRVNTPLGRLVSTNRLQFDAIPK